MRRAFLTRGLPAESPCFGIARAAGFELVARATLAIQYLPFDYPRAPDWLFAYSANAVQGFLQRTGARTWLAAHPTVRLAAMGPGTAETWRRGGREVDFVGGGAPRAVAEAFGAVATGQRVAFLQAEQSRESVAGLLGERVEATPTPTYRSVALAHLDVGPVDVGLLTSPKSAEAFLEAYAKTHGAAAARGLRLYAIGVTTAEAVGARGYGVGVAAEVSVRGLVEALFE